MDYGVVADSASDLRSKIVFYCHSLAVVGIVSRLFFVSRVSATLIVRSDL